MQFLDGDLRPLAFLKEFVQTIELDLHFIRGRITLKELICFQLNSLLGVLSSDADSVKLGIDLDDLLLAAFQFRRESLLLRL